MPAKPGTWTTKRRVHAAFGQQPRRCRARCRGSYSTVTCSAAQVVVRLCAAHRAGSRRRTRSSGLRTGASAGCRQPSGGRGVMTSWQCSSRSISAVGTPDGITRSVSPGACARRRAQQRRQQQVALQVVGGDGDAGLTARRDRSRGGGEARAVRRAARARGAASTSRVRGGDDAAARLHEQRVADDGAQLVEQMAHGRLRDVQALRRAGDRASPRSPPAAAAAGGRRGPNDRIGSWHASDFGRLSPVRGSGYMPVPIGVEFDPEQVAPAEERFNQKPSRRPPCLPQVPAASAGHHASSTASRPARATR